MFAFLGSGGPQPNTSWNNGQVPTKYNNQNSTVGLCLSSGIQTPWCVYLRPTVVVAVVRCVPKILDEHCCYLFIVFYCTFTTFPPVFSLATVPKVYWIPQEAWIEWAPQSQVESVVLRSVGMWCLQCWQQRIIPGGSLRQDAVSLTRVKITTDNLKQRIWCSFRFRVSGCFGTFCPWSKWLSLENEKRTVSNIFYILESFPF